VASMGGGDRRGAYRDLVGRSEVKKPLGIRWWEDIIKIDLQKFGWGAWAGLIWRYVLGSCECGDEPPGSVKCRECLD